MDLMPPGNLALISMVFNFSRDFCMGISSDIHVFPQVTDPDVKRALKDVLASDWGELEGSLKSIVMDALSKETDDKSGKEALANAWRSAEAVEHFSGVLESLRIEIDDISGSTGEVTLLGTSGISGSYIEQRS